MGKSKSVQRNYSLRWAMNLVNCLFRPSHHPLTFFVLHEEQGEKKANRCLGFYGALVWWPWRPSYYALPYHSTKVCIKKTIAARWNTTGQEIHGKEAMILMGWDYFDNWNELQYSSFQTQWAFCLQQRGNNTSPIVYSRMQGQHVQL